MMNSTICYILLFLLAAGCSKRVGQDEKSWRVTTVTLADFPVKPGMVLKFQGNRVEFADDSALVSFELISHRDRVLLEKGISKWLFSRDNSGDSIMTWKELYTDHPLVILMTK